MYQTSGAGTSAFVEYEVQLVTLCKWEYKPG